jgi:hypothetical protein
VPSSGFILSWVACRWVVMYQIHDSPFHFIKWWDSDFVHSCGHSGSEFFWGYNGNALIIFFPLIHPWLP